jgi:RNA 3'-terminal phosphate cyclase-like protein
MAQVLNFTGAQNFRQRIICSVISNRPIVITNIRDTTNDKEKRGLQPYEINLLRLIDKITKGTSVHINSDGTTLSFKPGTIANMNGQPVSHQCTTKGGRGFGYWIECLICIAPFGKKPLDITLTDGFTNCQKDISVDCIRNTTLFIMNHYYLKEENATLQVLKRGAFPDGGGQIKLHIPIIKNQLPPIQLLNEGMIKRIRGIAYSTRIAPAIANRIVESAKGYLYNFIPDVWIYTDHYTGKATGNSSGYAIYLQAESDTGVRLSVEYTPEPTNKDNKTLNIPEDVGRHCSKLLCEEIKVGGCVDRMNQWLVLLFMSLSSQDVSKVRLGKLAPYSIQWLRTIRDFFGVVFKITPDYETRTVVLSCVGSGYRNMSRKSN